MFGSAVLELAIGLVYVYLLLSVICTVLNEWIAGVLGLRAKTLGVGLRNLLDEPGKPSLSQRLLNHPLINALAPQGKTPSYIPARLFALALLDMIAPATEAGPQPLWSVRLAVAQLPDSDLRRTLLTLIQHTAGDPANARRNIEAWFSDAMDRVSGWYKRRSQLIVVCLALLLCAGLNADSFAIASGIWRDPTLRATVVASAEKAVPITGTNETQSLTDVSRISDELQQLSLPIGWSLKRQGPDRSTRPDPQSFPDTLAGALVKFLGIAFTAIAVSLGAPYWFDVLNMTLRAAGKKPAS